jgi:hypothetical protein
MVELIGTYNIRTGIVDKIKHITYGVVGTKPPKKYTVAFINQLFVDRGADAACEELYNAANDGSLTHKEVNILLEKYVPSQPRSERNYTPKGDTIMKRQLVISIDRPASHPKGEKHLAVIPIGGTVPAGVIIGKGSVLTIKQLIIWDDATISLRSVVLILDGKEVKLASVGR